MNQNKNESKIEIITKILESQKKEDINLDEFKQIFNNIKISDNHLEEIFKNIDQNRDYKLAHSEIITYFKEQEKKLKDLFDIMDQDKSGKISLSELKYALIESDISEFKDNQMENEELLAEKLMKIYDKNNDEEIDFEEFKDVLILIPNATLNYAVNWSMNTTASLSFLMENTIPMQLAHDNSLQFHKKDGNQKSKKSNSLNNFLSGGLAAALGRTFTAPLDRLKTLYQLNYKGKSSPPSILTGLKQIIEADGVKGLFKGNFVNILKASPDSSIKLCIFELLKEKLKNRKEAEISPRNLFIAGSISGVISCFCVYPLDVIRVRIAGSPSGMYKGIFDVVQKVWKFEGGIKSFFKGFSAAFASSSLNSGMNLSFYELLRKFAFKFFRKENLPIPVFMGIGAISASVTTCFLYPFNLLSARMIMQGISTETNAKKLNVMQMLFNVYHKEGYRGFYKGFAPTTSKIFLGNGVSFGSYEFCKKIFKKN